MWQQTPLTEEFNIEYPIIQAGMAGGATTPALVAAVSNSGGLGSLGAGYMAPSAIRTAIKDIRELTNRPFAVNLLVVEDVHGDPKDITYMEDHLRTYEEHLGESSMDGALKTPKHSFEEQLAVLLQEQIPFFSFTFGLLDSAVIQSLQANGTKVVGTATTVQEAVLLEESGVDAIVAQGSEAGGHRGSFAAPVELSLIGTMALVPQIVDHVQVPVIASGGIMDGRGIVASLALGAAGVQMGTAFLTSEESGIHAQYKETIQKSNDQSTVLTRAFSGKPARGIKNAFMQSMENFDGIIPPYPIQNALTKPMRAAAKKQNNIDYMSLWAGQAASLSKSGSAEHIMKGIISDTERILGDLH